MMERTPPRYSTLTLTPLPVYPTAGELDISTLGDPRSRDRTSLQAFEFCIENGNNQAWATLRLMSRVPASLQRPRYTSGDSIEGSVILDLKRPQTITSIAVLLRGKMITSSLSEGSHLFLEVTHPVWDSTSGVPPPGGSKVSSPSGKLQGQYSWPFSIPFPTEFQDASPGGSSQKYPTPQTVLARGINANIAYEVVLKITTGGLIGSKHRATATVIYVPRIRPPPISPLRTGAYLNSSYLVGPEEDPTGWRALTPMKFRLSAKGTSFSSSVDVECTVFVANPTVYTRGTVIPCYLVCKNDTSSSDGDAVALLHAFTEQKRISLVHYQKVQYHQDPRQALSSKQASNIKIKGSKAERANNSEECGVAVWWTPSASLADRLGSGHEGVHYSCLEGEIHLDVGDLPSCETPFLQVSHSVSASLKASEILNIEVLFPLPPPEVISRRPSGSKAPAELPSQRILSSLPVKIATANAIEGPIPAPFTPRPPSKKKDAWSVQEFQYKDPGGSGIIFMGR
ncbi:hypothetical protein DFP72DRAFT_893162 [Ephemerocybe angulata]|uniref:Arrestin-like N-terminal domain-containing protein n=1 Tax=Ephemerocybe angulata TaxID=980116 RepID=A0A8H6M5L8_9AGAR|nr:hypothetical protein DFP72DRAFT_893162 [Tulosesus angulatus]